MSCTINIQLHPLTVLLLILQNSLKAHKLNTFWKNKLNMQLTDPLKTSTNVNANSAEGKHIAWVSGALHQQACSTGLLTLSYLLASNYMLADEGLKKRLSIC